MLIELCRPHDAGRAQALVARYGHAAQPACHCADCETRPPPRSLCKPYAESLATPPAGPKKTRKRDQTRLLASPFSVVFIMACT